MGQVSPRVALWIAIAFGAASLIGALTVDAGSALLVLLGLAAGWAYDLWLKPSPLSFVPFAVAFPLLPAYVAVIAGRPLRSLTTVLLAGAVFAIAIHLADSLPDLGADAGAGLRTLGVQLGKQRSISLIVACLMLGLIVVLAVLRFHPMLSLGLFVAAVLSVGALIVMAGRRPEQARWIVSGFSLLAALALMTHLPNG